MKTATPNPLVLIVEDNDDTAASYRALLEASGYRTAIARDGYDAVQLAEAELPDAVVLDIGLPVLDGWGVATRLRKLGGPEKPFIVVVSGHADNDDRYVSAFAGVDLHLTKPADPTLLCKAVDSAIKGTRSKMSPRLDAHA